jgi:MmpS family membrane protein
MTQQYPPSDPQPHGRPDPRQWQGYGPPAQPPASKKRRKWPWIVGAVVLLFVVISVANGGDKTATAPTGSTGATQAPAPPNGAAPPAAAPGADDSATGSVVVYEVIGKGTGSVTYMKEGFAQEQQTAAKLPFKKELRFKDKVGSFAPLSLVAQNGSGGGDITCRITVDGKVVGESTSSGQYAVVTCNGNGG